ncbi:MAG: hypothetical protein NXI24_15160 [bacterium]|nr:hypothetical protein [bacterium]
MPPETPESQIVVDVSDDSVTVTRPDGTVETLRWTDLRGVLLETTDAGPFAPDVFWILIGTDAGCVVPWGATGDAALLARLQQLPGFDNEQVIAASTSTENARFVCWRAEAGD